MPCASPGIKEGPLNAMRSARRDSEASASDDDTSILDAFPLPKGLEEYHHQVFPGHLFENSTLYDAQEDEEDSDNEHFKQSRTPSIVSATSNNLSSPVKAPAPPRKSSAISMTQTERRYLRYGHSYNQSFGGQSCKQPSNHVTSRSWDAGEPHQLP